MGRAFWSRDEVEWLHRNPTATYWDFTNAWGSTRTNHSWRKKRREELGDARPEVSMRFVPSERFEASEREMPPIDIDIDDIPEDEEALERLFTAYKDVRNATNDLFAPVRHCHWYAPDNLPTGMAFIGDVHAGGNFEMELFERDLGIIRDTDGLYMSWMGDLIDNFKPQAKSGTALYHALFGNSDLQVAYITTRGRWVKEKSVVLCGGNHEGFDGRWAGIDRLPGLAKDWDCTYFTEAGGSLFVYVGEHRYHVILKHDYQGKSKINKGNSARRLWAEWPWSFENADAVVLAHLHEPHEEQPMLKGQPVAYQRTGTYKLYDDWAELNGYRPSYGVPMLIFFPEEREVLSFHGKHFLHAVTTLRAIRQEYGSR